MLDQFSINILCIVYGIILCIVVLLSILDGCKSRGILKLENGKYHFIVVLYKNFSIEKNFTILLMYFISISVFFKLNITTMLMPVLLMYEHPYDYVILFVFPLYLVLHAFLISYAILSFFNSNFISSILILRALRWMLNHKIIHILINSFFMQRDGLERLFHEIALKCIPDQFTETEKIESEKRIKGGRV